MVSQQMQRTGTLRELVVSTASGQWQEGSASLFFSVVKRNRYGRRQQRYLTVDIDKW